MRRNKVICKANDDIISHCDCKGEIATQGQADCPWCGCGWLFTCSRCRKAFTFGIVVETDMSAREIGEKLIGSAFTTSESEILAAFDWLSYELEVLEVGSTVIFLDGGIRPVDAPLAFKGWFAKHEFNRLPHLTSKNKAEINAALGDPEYWFRRQLT